MSAKIKSSNEFSEPGRSMGRTLEFKRSSSQQQSTDAVKEKILSTQARQNSKFQEKRVISNSLGQLSSDHQLYGLRHQMDDEHVMQQATPVTRQKQQLVSRNKDEELVKHMSNLPGYLQQAEKRKNVQDKALNFGVLDWKHLEKWRYNEHMPTRGQPKASSNGKSLGAESKKSRVSKTSVGRKQLSAGLQLKSSTEVCLSEDAQQSRGKFKQIQNHQIASGSGQQKGSSQKVKSSSMSCPRINHDRDKKKGANQLRISQDTVLMSTPPTDYQYGKSGKTGYNETNVFPKCSNTEPQNIVLLMPKCPSKKSSSQNFRLLESKTSPNGQLAKDAKNRYSGCFSSQELQSGELCDEIPHSCQNSNSIKSQSSEVKCSEAKFCKVDGSEQTESWTSSHGQLADCNWNRYSDCFSSQELHYGELHFDIPHSCPMPAPVAISQGKESDVCFQPFQRDISVEPRFSGATCPEATSCNLDDSSASVGSFKGKDLDLDLTKQTAGKGRHPSPNRRFTFSLGRLSRSFSFKESSIVPQLSFTPAAAKSGRESSEASAAIDDSKRDLDDSSASVESCKLDDSFASVESFKGMDLELAKQTASKGRHPSPNRRISFSFSRLSRSFSFKESSTVPQLSFTPAAAKSGRESSEASAAIDDSKRDKASASARRRPSPFRRILDPLLKPKGARSAETFQVSEKNSSFVNLQPINTNEPHFNEKNEALTFQALVQLTIKNGHPFFKFVVDNRRDILAAAVNQLPTSGKIDSTLTFSFYSVHEIKKKAGAWIHNGSKEKNCGFGYNIIGQMQISRSFSSDRSMVTESVLYDVNITEGDKGTPEISPNREIAAIIFKEPAAKCNGGESKAGNTDKQEGILGSSPGNTCDGGEKETFNGMTVILPGGLHSLPTNGAPSSLIHRWRSGGLCDCGGWDVGCKLKILTNHNKGSNFSTPAMSCSKLEHTSLFIQGEGKSHPIFSLAPFKEGIYSVEFNASVSLLEAFSICVAVITSQELSDVFDSNRLPDAKFSVKANSGNDVKKSSVSVTVQGEFPAKYVSSPPPSPVGRI